MSFSEDAQRNTAQYANGTDFETWKDWSYYTTLYFLPPAATDYTVHPSLDVGLLDGMLYFNTVEAVQRVYDDTTSSWLDEPYTFESLRDTPSDYGTAGEVAKTNGIDTISWDNVDWSEITGIPSEFAPSPHTHDKADLPSEIAYTDEIETITAQWQFDLMPTVGPSTYEIVPPGGTAAQVLSKVDGANWNTVWVDPASGTFDPAFDYTITGSWVFQALQSFQNDVVIKDGIARNQTTTNPVEVLSQEWTDGTGLRGLRLIQKANDAGFDLSPTTAGAPTGDNLSFAFADGFWSMNGEWAVIDDLIFKDGVSAGIKADYSANFLSFRDVTSGDSLLNMSDSVVSIDKPFYTNSSAIFQNTTRFNTAEASFQFRTRIDNLSAVQEVQPRTKISLTEPTVTDYDEDDIWIQPAS